VELLSYLNPIYRKGIIPQGNESYTLKLPTCKINSYLANVENIYRQSIDQEKMILAGNAPGDDANYISKTIKQYHKVKKGERLSYIADLYNCSPQEIKKWNKLKSTKLHSGQKLLVMMTIREKIEARAPVKIEDAICSSVKNDSASKTSEPTIATTE